MRFIAHQILLNPGCWIFFVLIGSAWTYRKWWYLAIPLGLLALSLFPKPIHLLLERLEREFPTWESHQSQAPYILVLGAGGTPDPQLGPLHQIGGSPLHRVMQGIRVWRHIPESLLVFSSAGRPGYPSQAEMYAEVARDWGVPDSVIRLVTTPKTTLEEARDFVEAFPQAQEIILVTSAQHMPRAKEIFEDYRLKVIPAPTDYRIRRHPDGERFPWIPQLEALQLWQGWLREKVGTWLWSLEKAGLVESSNVQSSNVHSSVV